MSLLLKALPWPLVPISLLSLACCILGGLLTLHGAHLSESRPLYMLLHTVEPILWSLHLLTPAHLSGPAYMLLLGETLPTLPAVRHPYNVSWDTRPRVRVLAMCMVQSSCPAGRVNVY